MQLQATIDGQHRLGVDWTTWRPAASSLVTATPSWWLQILNLNINICPKLMGRQWNDEASIKLVD